MEQLFITDEERMTLPTIILKTILHRPNCFKPAFQKYAKHYNLKYDLLQFVVGVPVDDHLHSNEIITKKQVRRKLQLDVKLLYCTL